MVDSYVWKVGKTAAKCSYCLRGLDHNLSQIIGLKGQFGCPLVKSVFLHCCKKTLFYFLIKF